MSRRRCGRHFLTSLSRYLTNTEADKGLLIVLAARALLYVPFQLSYGVRSLQRLI